MRVAEPVTKILVYFVLNCSIYGDMFVVIFLKNNKQSKTTTTLQLNDFIKSK